MTAKESMAHTSAAPGRYSRFGRTSASVWLALALGLIGLPAPAFFYFFGFPILGLFVIGGVAAVVLALRARRAGQRGPLPLIALGLGAVSAVLNAAFVVVGTVLVATGGPTLVELRTEGGADYTIQYEDDYSERDDAATTDMVRMYVTERSWAEITATPPVDGDPGQTYSCTILWDEVVVAEESSDTGPVTCRYDSD